VVGAGPAGSVAALAVLASWPGARVALLDRCDFPRDKTCGDGLAPQVLDVLAAVGEPDLLDGWPRVHRLRLGFPDGTAVVRSMARPTLVIPREELDARLVAAAVNRGAVLRRHRVRRIHVLPASRIAAPDRSGPRRTPGRGSPAAGAGSGGVLLDGALRAGVVIGADGVHSAVRTGLGLPPPGRGTTAIALRAYVTVHPDRAEEQVIAFAGHSAWPAYAWSFPLGDGRANVGYGEALPVRGAGSPKALMLQRLEELLPGSIDGATGLKAYHLPLSTGRVRQPDGPVLLAGDALGLVNPLTGEGIHAAVRSGSVAGEVAARAARAGAGALAGRAYRHRLGAVQGRHLRHMDLVARLVADPRVMRAGLQVCASDQRVFDTMVELGLADGTLTPHLVRALARRAGPGGVAQVLRSVRRC
jgi:flavin-dependent dehydrogenase